MPRLHPGRHMGSLGCCERRAELSSTSLGFPGDRKSDAVSPIPADISELLVLSLYPATWQQSDTP